MKLGTDGLLKSTECDISEPVSVLEKVYDHRGAVTDRLRQSERGSSLLAGSESVRLAALVALDEENIHRLAPLEIRVPVDSAPAINALWQQAG